VLSAGSAFEVVVAGPAILGEGPSWHPFEDSLWWVDIEARRLFRLDPRTGEARDFRLPERIGCYAFRRDGSLVVALESGFWFFEPVTGALQPIHDPEPDLPKNRFNDGRCDPRGRFFAGTMDMEERAFSGTLWRLDPDLSVHAVERGIGISNGIDWSPDGRRMYHTDSLRRTIWVYDYDPQTATAENRRVFVRLEEHDGFPDGLCVDAEGCVWSAIWDGGRILRFDPEGRIERGLTLPVPRPTACCFGGAGLDTLYVTTARIGLDGQRLQAAPLSGALFACVPGVRGRRAVAFAG
jgi:sugar lactone lactonase YvrE